MTALPATAAPSVVHGGGLLLRPWTQTDAPALLAAVLDPLTALWNPKHVTTLAEAQEWCRAESSLGETAIGWAVEADGAVVGGVAIHHLSVRNAGAEVGYWTFPAARGRGVATRATLLARAVAFDALGLERLMAFHGVGNEGSCRVATAAGLVLEGTHRKSYRYGDGELHDEHSHAVLAADCR